MSSVIETGCFVGLDYHDCFIQVCVLDSAGEVLTNLRVENRIAAVTMHVDRVRGGRAIVAAGVEACCGSSQLAEQLVALGWPIKLAHAGICEKMKKSPEKHDFGDARILADLCRVGYLPEVWLPPKNIRDLRRLTRYRQQLVDQRRDVKLRIRAMLREERIEAPECAEKAWSKPWFEWLKKTDQLKDHSRWVMDSHIADLERLKNKIKEVEDRMEKATEGDTLVQNLRKIKGIGLVTAVVMRAEIGDIKRFKCGKQLSRYCAVTPMNVSSGKRVADAGLTQAGSKALRTVIIEAAHRLTRYHPQWKEMKKQLVSRGKPGSVAAAAVANRWVRRLFWELRTESQIAA